MKTNIKMKCNDNQFRKVMNILKIDYEKEYHYGDMFIIIDNSLNVHIKYGDSFYIDSRFEEIDADLFIRTKGTCEEISDEGLSKIKAASDGKPTEYLQEKIINLHKQINKDRIIIKNQREELNKLNLKLQKCIILEEHNIRTEKLRDTIVSLRDDVINKVDNMRDTKNKEIEKLKAVIEYLESKVK